MTWLFFRIVFFRIFFLWPPPHHVKFFSLLLFKSLNWTYHYVFKGHKVMAIFSSGGSGPVIWQIFSSLLLNHPLDAVTLGEGTKKNLLPKQKGQKIFQKFCTVFWGALEHFNRSKEVVGIDLWQWICDKPWPAAVQRASSYTLGLENRLYSENKNWNFLDKTKFFIRGKCSIVPLWLRFDSILTHLEADLTPFWLI